MKNRFNYTSTIVLRPYSLVEMLVVLAIIAILVGIGAGGYTVARRWLAQSRTEALLAKLKIAIESYKNDKGYYPLPYTAPEAYESAVPPFRLDSCAKDFDPPVFSDALQPRNNMNKYLDSAKIKADQSFKFVTSGATAYFLKDGWNTPSLIDVTIVGPGKYSWGAIKYRCPGLINKTSFDLYSAGNDRKFASDPANDTEDDVYVQF